MAKRAAEQVESSEEDEAAEEKAQLLAEREEQVKLARSNPFKGSLHSFLRDLQKLELSKLQLDAVKHLVKWIDRAPTTGDVDETFVASLAARLAAELEVFNPFGFKTVLSQRAEGERINRVIVEHLTQPQGSIKQINLLEADMNSFVGDNVDVRVARAHIFSESLCNFFANALTSVSVRGLFSDFAAISSKPIVEEPRIRYSRFFEGNEIIVEMTLDGPHHALLSVKARNDSPLETILRPLVMLASRLFQFLSVVVNKHQGPLLSRDSTLSALDPFVVDEDVDNGEFGFGRWSHIYNELFIGGKWLPQLTGLDSFNESLLVMGLKMLTGCAPKRLLYFERLKSEVQTVMDLFPKARHFSI